MSKNNHPSRPFLEEKYYRKLTIRNSLLSILIFVSPFLLLFFIINRQISTSLKDQIYKRLANTVEENARTIDIFLKDREIDLSGYARLDIENIEEVSKFSSILLSLIREKKWYDFILISDLEGNIRISINRDIKANIADREYFRMAKEGKSYSSGIFYSDLLESPVMIISHPILNRQREIVGVLAASIELGNFYELLVDLGMAETSEIFLVDEEGNLLSPTKLGGKPFVDKGYYSPGENPHKGLQGIITHLDYRGQSVLCAYKKMPQTNFYLVSEMDLREALLPVRKMNKTIILVFLPFFLLLLVVSTLYSRRITSLLRRLIRVLERALSEAYLKRKEVNEINLELKRKVEESEQLSTELRLSEEYIRSLIDSISLGFIGLDREAKIIHYNHEAKTKFGLEDGDKNRDVFSTLSWLNDEEIREAFKKSISTRLAQQLVQKKIERNKIEEYFNLSFFPIIRENGEVQGATLLIESVTERKRLRDQLAEYEKLSALSHLALGAAHEINNPLLGISSYLENLSEETEDREKKEEIGFVLENVYRISETIRGLLNFARPSPPQFTKVNLNSLIQDTLSFLSHQPTFRKVKIQKILSPSLPQITADLGQIRQVLINVLLNAAQSMPNGGNLRVETSKVKFKEIVEIDIVDTGIGIPPENMSKIFDPFFTTKKSQGTGLGLSISLSYIKNHNGDIQVRSEVGKGTTVSIFLPIRQTGRKFEAKEEVIS